MKIRSMTATFGKLEQARLELGDGLNLIYAPNEAGKSTWAAFWRAMLYGVDTRDRDKKGYLADKNRYQPWSGAPMAGELEVEWQGRSITIRRGPRGSIPFGAFSAVYTGTEEPVPQLTATNCGELLTGAGLEVFSRSAFIGGENLALSSAPELERRIAALVSSGEETVSFTQVQSRLKDWQNKRRVNKSVGEIPRLELQLSQINQALTTLEEITGQIAQLEEERNSLLQQQEALTSQLHAQQAAALSGLEAELQRLEEGQQQLETQRQQLLAEAGAYRRHLQAQLDDRYTQASRDLKQAEAQLESLLRESGRFAHLPDQERLKNAQGDLQYLKVLDEEIKSGKEALQQAEDSYVQAQINAQDQRFAGLSSQEAADNVRKVLADYQQSMETSNSKYISAKLFPLFGALLLVITGMLGWVREGALFSTTLMGGGAALLLSLLISVVNLTSGKEWRERARQCLTRYDAQSPEELESFLNNYQSRCQAAEEAAQQVRNIRGALSDRKARRENIWTDLLAFVHSFAPEVKNAFGCSAALSRALGLDHELDTARERVVERRRRLEDLEAQGGRLSDGQDPGPLPARTPDQIRQALEEAESALECNTRLLEQARGRLAAVSARPDALEPAAPSASSQRLHQELELVAQRLEQTSAQLNQAWGRQRAVGDPAALAAQREALETALARRTQEYEAISLAMEMLQNANVQLQERFSPELNQLAGQYLARLTGERYSALTLSRQLEGSVRQDGDVLPRSALYLSRGTADQLYLAVRLAICQLCLPDRPPIILDDALAAFDDQRLQLALELLLELSHQQQFLLFSCHSREAQLLAGQPGISLISLP